MKRILLIILLISFVCKSDTVELFAEVNGSENPPIANDHVINGDFYIEDHCAENDIAGNGVDEDTSWVFDLTSDSDYSSELRLTDLQQATLMLKLEPKEKLITTDIVEITGITITTPFIQSLPVNMISIVEIDLLDYVSQSELIRVLNSTEGELQITYRDDAIISQSSIQLFGNVGPKCEYILSSDINNDCVVDLLDFAIMAQDWLIDCQEEPTPIRCIKNN